MTLDTTTATTNRTKHLLSLMDCSGADVAGLLNLAAEMKADRSLYRSALSDMTLPMIFQKRSTRTRVLRGGHVTAWWNRAVPLER